MSKLFPKIFGLISSANSIQIRSITRWNHRRPARVLTHEEGVEELSNKFAERKVVEDYQDEDEFFEDEEVEPERKSTVYKLKSRGMVPMTISKEKVNNRRNLAKPSCDMLETVIDAEGNYVYTKLRNNDARIGHILSEIKSKNKDKEEKNVILLEGKRLIAEALVAKCKLDYILFSRVEDLEFIRPYLPKLGAKLFKMPYREMQNWSDLTTNPGIMGIFKRPKSEDFVPKNPIPVTVICDNIREPNNLGAILRTCSGVGCESIILTKGCVNVWDSKVLRGASGAHFNIQIHRKLNWDEIIPLLGDNYNFYLADHRKVSEAEQLDINILPYYGIDYKIATDSGPIVLVIGGETEGISSEAYELCRQSQGVRVNIPLGNGVDSLNSGTALGIIAFEIKRQLSVARI